MADLFSGRTAGGPLGDSSGLDAAPPYGDSRRAKPAARGSLDVRAAPAVLPGRGVGLNNAA